MYMYMFLYLYASMGCLHFISLQSFLPHKRIAPTVLRSFRRKSISSTQTQCPYIFIYNFNTPRAYIHCTHESKKNVERPPAHYIQVRAPISRLVLGSKNQALTRQRANPLGGEILPQAPGSFETWLWLLISCFEHFGGKEIGRQS